MHVYKTVMETVEKVKELLPKFKELADQVKDVIEKAPETFENPMDAIKEALPEAGGMEMVKIAGEATKNLMKVKDCAKIVATFIQTVKRLGGELEAGITEIKAQLPAAA